MTHKPLAVGLIGVGGFGASHLRALRQLEAEGSVRLVCAADPDSKGLAETRAGLEQTGVHWYLDYRNLLEQEAELDALAIAAPIHLHFEITAAALKRELFVYLEKPPVPLIQQLDKLIALDVHRRVVVGFQLIHSSAVQQLKLWRAQGALGDIRSLRAYGCSPRSAAYYTRSPWAGKMVFDGRPVFDGPATNALSHWLHNIMYLGGVGMDEFDSPFVIEAELYRAKSIESYDTICLRGQLGSGADFHYAVTHATETSLPCRLEIIGTNGRAWVVENQASAKSDLDLLTTTAPCPDPFLESYREFVRFACGEAPCAATHLENTRGYVLATNAAWMSTEGVIVDIDSPAELAGFIENSGRDEKMFSETNARWARSGISVQVDHVKLWKYMDSIK